MQAVMMVAGKSTRTYPLTLTRPKPLLPIANKPLIIHSLDQMLGIFNEVILIVGYCKEMIITFLGNKYKGIKIVYQEQKEQLGTGHAVLQAKPHIKERFVALNGDDLFSKKDFEELIKYNYAALAKKVEKPSIYGVFKVDDSNMLLDLVEKPKEYIGNLVNIGCYIFEPDIFNTIENLKISPRGEIEITDAITEIANNKDFNVIPIKGFWLPTGFAWDLLSHQEFIMNNLTEYEIKSFIKQDVVIKGKVKIGVNTVIKSGAYIEGPAVIGDFCEIGPNSVIIGSTSIGDNCRIADKVNIKNSIIMDRTFIGVASKITNSIIGTDCIIEEGVRTEDEITSINSLDTVQSMIKGKMINTYRIKLGAIISDNVKISRMNNIKAGIKVWPETTTLLPNQIIDKDIIPAGFNW